MDKDLEKEIEEKLKEGSMYRDHDGVLLVRPPMIFEPKSRKCPQHWSNVIIYGRCDCKQ